VIVECHNAGRPGLDNVNFHSLPDSHLCKAINQSSISLEAANTPSFSNRKKFQRYNLSAWLMF
jgi:hypothetical protein